MNKRPETAIKTLKTLRPNTFKNDDPGHEKALEMIAVIRQYLSQEEQATAFEEIKAIWFGDDAAVMFADRLDVIGNTEAVWNGLVNRYSRYLHYPETITALREHREQYKAPPAPDPA